MMKLLREWLAGRGVKFILRRLESLDEVKEDLVVINCTGMNGPQLSGKTMSDDGVIPVQGHLIRLRNQARTRHGEWGWGGEFQY